MIAISAPIPTTANSTVPKASCIIRIVPIWRRLRRRSMAPRRPVLHDDQWALALVTGIVLVGSIALVVWAVFG
jgi:hypothetical protein